MQTFCSFFPIFKPNLLEKRVFSLLNAALVVAKLDLTPRVHLSLFTVMLPKQFQYAKCPAVNPIFPDLIIIVTSGECKL
jgi:hypothetical protein